MSDQLHTLLSLDVPPLLAASFAVISCALLGNYLLLRRMSLMGDAISHSVLPGIVVAFLVSGSRSTWPVFLGAAAAGILTVLLVELVSKLGRVESGAAMGVVFSILFALGVLLIEQAAARSVDLDAECLLHGQLETIFWYPAREWREVFSLGTLGQLPKEVFVSFSVAIITLGFILLFYKELAITSFDPGLAGALGFRVGFMHYLLMVGVAAAVVASFEIVGSILVIAMLICPAAISRFLTDRLKIQLLLSVLIAVAAVWLGYIGASFGPQYFGSIHSLNAAGMMTVMLAAILVFAMILAPQYGVLAKWVRKLRITRQIAREDLLAVLFRLEESVVENERPTRTNRVLSMLPGGRAQRLAVTASLKAGEIESASGSYQLTAKGREVGRSLVRKHRLWETYLVDEAALRPDHVHETATQLEHFTSPELESKLAGHEPKRSFDPHGREIPE